MNIRFPGVAGESTWRDRSEISRFLRILLLKSTGFAFLFLDDSRLLVL